MDLTDNKDQVKKNAPKNKGQKKGQSKHFKNKKRQPLFALEVFVTTLKLFVLLALIVGFATFGAVLGIGKAYLDSTPELDIAKIEDQSETSFIYDKDGNLITEYFGFENRVWAPIDEIPQMLKDAYIAVEDVRFYTHKGVDFKRLIGAFVSNLTNSTVQGASTITQQVIKNSLLSPEQTYKRKIQEAYLSFQLERKYDKDQILEAYLNTNHLGGSNYGVKVAAKDYFDKELDELTIRECAILAGAVQNPSKFDPRRNLLPEHKGGRGTPEWTYRRTNIVLRAMLENGFISQSEYDSAKFDEENPEVESNKVSIVEKPQSKQMYPMPYFIEHVIYEVRDKLMQQKKWQGDEGRRKAEQLIYAGGLKIYATVDPEVQIPLEETVYNYENLPKLANPQQHSVSTQGAPQPQVAAVIMDQHTGEIRGIVGGKQPPTQQRQLNRAIMSQLALGSSMKPLAVYGPFIEAGYPGGIIFENIPAPINGWKSDKGYPQNYAGGGYTGPADVRTGIQKSLNIVAARIVADPNRLGPSYSANKLVELGINEDDIPGYADGAPTPAALALGTHGNNMVEVTAAFSTIANEGIYQEPISFTKVLDKNDNEILSKNSQITRSVFKESTAFILTDWMQEAVRSGTGTRARFGNMPVAGKTGTNADFRGVYFAGFTPYYTGAVWIGHDNHHPLASGTQGGTFAAPLWKAIMEPIHQGLENRPFYESTPEGVVRATVCPVSGLLPNGDLCAADSKGRKLITEYFPAGAVPTKVCDVHKQVKMCETSGKYPTPYCPESEVTTKAVVTFPEGSPYLQLSDAKLQEYFPGAMRKFSGYGNLDYENPDHAKYFCPIHTKEWKEKQNELEVLRHQARSLIDQIKNWLKESGIKKNIKSDEAKQVQNAIAKLEKVVEQSRALPGEDGKVEVGSTEIKNAMTELENIKNTIAAKIKDREPVEEPKPKPQEPEPQEPEPQEPEPDDEEDDDNDEDDNES